MGYIESHALARPLFYLVAAVGTVLLFPAHLQLFWAFHVLLLAQIAEDPPASGRLSDRLVAAAHQAVHAAPCG